MREEIKEKIRKTLMNHPVSEASREKIRQGHLGKKLTDEHKNKISKAHKGKIKSDEHRRNLAKAQTGKRYSKESKDKMSFAKKGEKSSLWRGGVTNNPYSVDWTRTLKRSIRERDKYVCQLCGKEPSISVHHIDYDKQNCNPNNLVTLCQHCHSKTNHNREYWSNYFIQITGCKTEDEWMRKIYPELILKNNELKDKFKQTI